MKKMHQHINTRLPRPRAFKRTRMKCARRQWGNFCTPFLMDSCAETYKLSSFIKTHNPSSDKNPTLTSDNNSPKVSGRISHAYLLELAEKLIAFRTLSLDEYESLISFYDKEVTDLLTNEAKRIREDVYGTTVYIRGLIEISNYCKNDCLYCGIRKSNHSCTRYRLTPQDILECACEGYRLGFRTFVLQGGEDPWFNDDRLVDLLHELKSAYPDCAITLSLGERTYESYQRLFNAGADRYLLRHETVCEDLYSKLHPQTMHLENRLQCLEDLRSIGYAVGCGFMVGAPYQTARDLAHDLKFIEHFKPEMCGIGPFIPHHATPFRAMPAGSVDLTCFLLSLIRIIHPSVLLPATTALGSLDPQGRTKGMLTGANVVMPNLSPLNVRANYELYNNKAHTGTEAAEHLSLLDADMQSIGYHLVIDRGDPKERL